MSPLDAAYNVVHDYPGGSIALAPRIDKSSTTLSHELTQTGSSKLGLMTALKITQLTGDMRILNAFASNCKCMVIQLPDEGMEVNSYQQLANLAREFSEFVQSVSESVSDGSVTDNELDRVRQELGQLVVAAQKIDSHLASINLNSKPRRSSL